MTTVLLYVSLGLACVLVVRKPVRRLFGAGPAFTLWLLPWLLAALPWLLAALPWLPSVPVPTVLAPAWQVAPMAALLPVGGSAAWSSAWLAAQLLWLVISIWVLLRLIVRYARLRRAARLPLPGALSQLRDTLRSDLHFDATRVRIHPAGPAVLWGPRSLLLLPADFLTRLDPEQQRMILQHELMHLRRGDPWWSALAEVSLALLWFHPLAWLALPRLRLDQELACDERVLLAQPHTESRYANTLLQSIGVRPTPALIPWLAEPQLKERLKMIGQSRPGAWRRRAGFITVATLMAGTAFALQAAAPPPPDRPASSIIDFNSHITPRYPADAVKNHEQGTVVLDVLVGADGAARNIAVHSADNVAPSLVQAAIETAGKWRFGPQMKDGKAVEGHVLVPVRFSISDEAVEKSAAGSMPASGARISSPPAPPAFPAPAASPALRAPPEPPPAPIVPTFPPPRPPSPIAPPLPPPPPPIPPPPPQPSIRV